VNLLFQIGRYFFAIPIIAFGIQYFLYGRFVGGLPPVPPWTPGGAVSAYLLGAFLVATGVSITIGRKVRWSALLVGSVFLLCVLLLHGLRMHDILVDGIARTRALEPLALSGVAFALGGFLSDDRTTSSPAAARNGGITRWGHFLFALPMVIFGVQHFQFAPVIAGLIPSWIPGDLFWAYFTGAAFVVAALSIMLNRLGRLGATLLGIMFFLWVVVLHAPRVLASVHNGDEWSSAFVALTMSGGAFIVAGTLPDKDSARL
jgi:uncharacterized membrane protein